MSVGLFSFRCTVSSEMARSLLANISFVALQTAKIFFGQKPTEDQTCSSGESLLNASGLVISSARCWLPGQYSRSVLHLPMWSLRSARGSACDLSFDKTLECTYCDTVHHCSRVRNKSQRWCIRVCALCDEVPEIPEIEAVC